MESGAPIALCDASNARGGSWGEDGYIIAALNDSKESKQLLANPAAGIIAQDISAVKPRWFLLFTRNQALMAQELDLKALQLRGDAVLIADAVASDMFISSAEFSTSRNGILALIASSTQQELVLLDRVGKRLGPGMPVSVLAHPSFAPDGNTLIYNQIDPRNGVSELWRLDLGRNTTSVITFDTGSDFGVFSPDGASVAYCSSKTGLYAISRQSSGGATTMRSFSRTPTSKRWLVSPRMGGFLHHRELPPLDPPFGWR